LNARDSCRRREPYLACQSASGPSRPDRASPPTFLTRISTKVNKAKFLPLAAWSSQTQSQRSTLLACLHYIDSSSILEYEGGEGRRAAERAQRFVRGHRSEEDLLNELKSLRAASKEPGLTEVHCMRRRHHA